MRSKGVEAQTVAPLVHKGYYGSYHATAPFEAALEPRIPEYTARACKNPSVDRQHGGHRVALLCGRMDTGCRRWSVHSVLNHAWCVKCFRRTSLNSLLICMPRAYPEMYMIRWV